MRRFPTALRGVLLALVVGAVALGVARGGSRPSATARPNVVLIVVDALRRDHLGSFGYDRPTSPTLDELARRGVLFTNLSSVSSQTATAVASLLTGRYPSETGVQFHARTRAFGDGRRRPHLDDSLIVLAESMRDAGYATAAVVANPWLAPDTGYAQGFDAFVEIVCGGLRPTEKPPCDAAQVTGPALALVEKSLGRPFFLYLHLMDVHSPYVKPGLTQRLFVTRPGHDRYRNGPVKRLADRDREFMVALYDEGIVRVDAAIASFLDRLRAFARPEDTLVTITADHGDEFVEHGGLGHGTTLYDELVGSFLLLYRPGALAPRRVDSRGSLIDVRPTLEELAGVPSGGSTGTSLASLARGEAVRRPGDLLLELGEQKAIIRDDWKLIVHPGSGRAELYDLRADVGEHRDRSAQAPERRETLRAALDAHLSAAVAPETTGDLTPLDPARIERLRALGYVAPPPGVAPVLRDPHRGAASGAIR